MNRREFMDELERLLQDVPEGDRIDALQFYEDYFEDGGYEKEQDIIKELKSPENVAEIIKKDLGIFSEEGSRVNENNKSEYKDYRSSYSSQQNYNNNEGAYNAQSDNNNNGYSQNYNESYDYTERSGPFSKIDKKLIIIILICTLPITIGPVLGFFGTIFGIVVGVFGLAFGLYAGGIGCIIATIVLLVTGVFPVASLVFGIGLLLIAFALLDTILCSLMCRVVIPVIFDGIKKLYRYIFKDGEVTA